MSFLTNEQLDNSVAVHYFDQTGDYVLNQTVQQHRDYIDEYHSACGIPLDECEIHSDNQNIIDYLQ